MNQYVRIIKKPFLYSSLTLASVLISLFLCDGILDFLNFPSEILQRVSHPAYYEEVRQNIEFQYVFKTNSRGLRYQDIPTEKPANTWRIFVSGDSFTEGVGVDEGKRFTDLLENQFNSSASHIQFINGGLAGTGPLQYGRLFLKVGLEYNSDALLICLYVNDVANTPEEIANSPFGESPPSRTGIQMIAYDLWPRIYTLLKKIHRRRVYLSKTKTSDFILTVSKKARKRNIPQPQIERWKASLPPELVEAVNQGHFNGAILSYGLLYPQYWSDSIDISRDVAKKKWKNLTRSPSEILSKARQSRIETAVVLIPGRFMYDPKSHSEKNLWLITGSEVRSEWLSRDNEIQKKMLLWTRSEGVPFLDLTSVFRMSIQSNNNFNWELDGHWNDLGHELASKAIASWLYDQQVFSFVKRQSLTNQ